MVFLRNLSEEFDALFSSYGGTTGIYLFGCGNEIVYVGQSFHLTSRSIESLGNIYHRVSVTSLPWSIAYAPCPAEEMNERESTAIRLYAPRFNTSIPSLAKSQGRLPVVTGKAPVFQDQAMSCAAFTKMNLKRQIKIAAAHPNPPWKSKTKRRTKTETSVNRNRWYHTKSFHWVKKLNVNLIKTYGVPISNPLPFRINLCDDGCVVTEDGEIIGTWQMDGNEHPSFTPDGLYEPLLFDVFLGSLCLQIAEWHNTNSGKSKVV